MLIAQRFLVTACVVAGAALVVGCEDSAPNPGVDLVVDGKKQSISGTVSCSSHSAGKSIKVGQLPKGIRVQLEPELAGVGEVSLGNSTGTSLVLDKDASAKVTLVNDGKYDYDITGWVVPEDTHNGSGHKPFELKIKCP